MCTYLVCASRQWLRMETSVVHHEDASVITLSVHRTLAQSRAGIMFRVADISTAGEGYHVTTMRRTLHVRASGWGHAADARMKGTPGVPLSCLPLLPQPGMYHHETGPWSHRGRRYRSAHDLEYRVV